MSLTPISKGQFRVTLAAAVALVGVASCAKAKNEIPVGAFLSLTGADSTFGIDTKDGIELATEEVNSKGGILGKQVHVFYEDNKTLASEATQKVQQLIDRQHVVAVLGEVASSRSIAGGIVANAKKVPLISPSATAIEFTKNRPYVFRSCFTDAQQGDAAAKFIWEKMGKKTVAVFFAAQDSYSSGLADRFTDTFTKLGGKVVVRKGFQKGETNFTTYLGELKAANAEALFLPVYYSEMVQIARQAKSVGIPSSSFVGGDGWDSTDLLEGAGPDLEGATFTNHYAPDVPWPNSRAFISGFKAKFGHEPNGLAAQGYDSAQLLYDAMKRSGDLTPESIKNAIGATRGFKGATGDITIDSERNAIKPVVIVKIEKSQFHYLTEFRGE